VGRVPRENSTPGVRVFFFFSNRLGCLGSVLISLVLTGLLLLILL